MIDWLFGFVGPSVWGPIAFGFFTVQVTMMAITVYLHRYSAHRSLELHSSLQHFFRFWVWMTTGMATKEWTAVHRLHHAKTETKEDPHSPQVVGLANIVFKGVKYYRQAATNEEILRIYGKGTPDDWLERNVYVPKELTGIGLLLVIDLLLFGVSGVLVWGVQMVWTPFWAAGVINGIGHAWGYRNFECPGHATNMVPWGILIGGEELHNNHHTYPNSPKLSVKRWEFDIGWMWIRIFETLGLAKHNRVGPVVETDRSKGDFDLDSIIGLINDRYNVLANFGKRVVAPVVRAQRFSSLPASSRRLLRRGKSLICREAELLTHRQVKQLAELKSKFPTLSHVHDLRVKLTEICKDRSTSMSEIQSSLRAWCHDAEVKLRDVGYSELQDFIRELKYYSIPRATA